MIGTFGPRKARLGPGPPRPASNPFNMNSIDCNFGGHEIRSLISREEISDGHPANDASHHDVTSASSIENLNLSLSSFLGAHINETSAQRQRQVAITQTQIQAHTLTRAWYAWAGTARPSNLDPDPQGISYLLFSLLFSSMTRWVTRRALMSVVVERAI